MSIHTIRYNEDVVFTDANGVSFQNVTTGEVTTAVVMQSVSPNHVLQFDVTWLVEPVTGDVIRYRYNANNILSIADDTTIRLNGVGPTVLFPNATASVKFTLIMTDLKTTHKSLFSASGNDFFYLFLGYSGGQHFLKGSVFGAFTTEGVIDIQEGAQHIIELFWDASPGGGGACGVKFDGVVVATGISGGNNMVGDVLFNKTFSGVTGIDAYMYDIEVYRNGEALPWHAYELREGTGTVATNTGSAGGADGTITIGSGEWLPAGTFTDEFGGALPGAIMTMTNCLD